MSKPVVVIAGRLGQAAMRHFAELNGWAVIAFSPDPPRRATQRNLHLGESHPTPSSTTKHRRISVDFDLALPGGTHMPSSPAWSRQLKAPDFQHIVAEVDALSYHAMTVSEHIGMPYFEVPRLGPYWLHALSALSFVAGASKRVRIDATVLVLPYHHPLSIAKALATIDVLSGGRLNVSVGVGHATQEFKVLGVPFSERGARTDEALEVIKTLWSEDEPHYQGRFFEVSGLAFEPKPVQSPRPPIYIGGNSKAALRRAARHDGWQPNPTGFTLYEMPPLLDYLRQQPAFSGKEHTFDLFWLAFPDGPRLTSFATASAQQLTAYGDYIITTVDDLARLGVTRISIPLPRTDSMHEYIDYLRWFSGSVIDATSSTINT